MKSIAVLIAALLVPPGAAQAQTQVPADCSLAVTISAGTAPKDAAALLRLGDLYYKGGAMPRDYAKALAYYQLAMKTGSATAKAQVGQMVALGLGVPQDVQRGRDILKEAAAAGNASAQLALGDLAATGKAGLMNPAEAIASYTAAADAGNTWAMIKLADIYRYGRFARPKPRQAAALYKRAADAGNAYGELGLGSMNLERQGGSPPAGRRLLASASSIGARNCQTGQSAVRCGGGRHCLHAATPGVKNRCSVAGRIGVVAAVRRPVMWHCHAIVERLTRSEASPHTVSSLGAVPSVIAVVAMPAAVITAVAMHLYSVAE